MGYKISFKADAREDSPWVKTVFASAGFLLVLLLVWPLATFLFGQLALAHAESVIVEHSERSYLLVRGLLFIVGVPFVWALSEVLRLPRLWGQKTEHGRRQVAGVVLTISLAAYFLVLYGVSRDVFFTRSGEPQKWCAETPEGLRCFDQPGFDPVYGIELQPPTPELVTAWKREELGQVPARVRVESVDRVDFFDPLHSGKAQLWYGMNRQNEIEFFDRSGFHPVTGTKLEPVTSAVIDRFEAQRAERLQEESSRREAERRQAQAEKAHREVLQQNQERAEAERKRRERVARYINSSALGQGPQIMVVDSEGRFDPSMTQRLAEEFDGRVDLFRPAFIADGLFARAHAGDSSVLAGLGLHDSRGPILLGHVTKTVTRSNYPESGLRRAEVVLQVRRVDPSQNFAASLHSARGIGAAFQESEAIARAQEQAVIALVQDIQ